MIQTPLEDAVLQWLAENCDDPILASQAEHAAITRREYTGAGYFFGLSVPDNIDRLDYESGDIDPIPGPQIESPELESGADSVVFVKDGAIECLEIFSYSNAFPETLRRYRLMTGVRRDV